MKQKRLTLPNGRRRALSTRVKQALAPVEASDLFALAPTTMPGNTAMPAPPTMPTTPKLRPRILLFGAGSVGSHLADQLAGALAPVIDVFDYKAVAFKHIQALRTLYEQRQLGQLKVQALKDKLQRDHPGTVVHPYASNVGAVPDADLMHLVTLSDLMVLALDDPVEILRLSDMAYAHVPMVHAAMHARAASGHIVITQPHKTPCLRCVLEVDGAHDIHRLDGEPGEGWHIRRIAHEAAAMAIDLLQALATGVDVSRWDPTKDLVYISNTRQALSPDGPGLVYEASRRRPGCPICNQPPRS